jgi:LysR family transcriptional regulator for metE and metH
MLDRQQLSVLREVDRLGSVTAAAERMNVTQPAISHMIRKLEERHGIKIWIKQGRSLRLTQAGQYLLALAQRILPQLDHAERVLSDYAIGRRGALRVGMECHPCQKWLMRVTAPYLSAWPDVDFELRTAFPLNGISALGNHEIDLLITPDPVELPGLRYTCQANRGIDPFGELKN